MRVSFGTVVLAGFMGMTGTGAAEAQALTPPLNLDTSHSAAPYDVKNMSFDLWCQETQRYPAERCKARMPEDVKQFNDYRDAVERYELEYLKQVEKNQDERDRTNRDPLGMSSQRLDATP